MLLGSVLALIGCASSGASGTSRADPTAGVRIDELNLVALPMPITVNSRPGSADGIAVKVYGIDRQRPKAQPIRKGTIELHMYDGVMNSGRANTNTNRLVRVWSFPASELPAHAFVSTVGTGYFFTLAWSNTPPRGHQITVVARYLPPQGTVVSSGPNFIALSPPPPQ